MRSLHAFLAFDGFCLARLGVSLALSGQGPAPSCSGYEERAPQQRRKRKRTEEQSSRRLVVRFWKALLLESEICPWCFWRNAPGIPCLESEHNPGLLSSKGSKHKNASASTPASATQTQRPLGPGRRGGGGPPLLHEQYCNCRPCHVVPGKCDKLQLTSSLKGASSEPLREPTPVEHIATGSNVRQTIDAFRASHLPRCFRGTAAGSQPSLLRGLDAWDCATMPAVTLLSVQACPHQGTPRAFRLGSRACLPHFKQSTGETCEQPGL